jgi:hypothetical protein
MQFLARVVTLSVLALALGGCGGSPGGAADSSGNPSANSQSGSGSDSNSAIVDGQASNGAPVQNGNVAMQCATGPALTATTDANGAWSVVLSGQGFPCLVSVSGGSLPPGQSLYSLALAAGHLNVTPLTTMMLASGFAMPPALLATNIPPAAQAAAALLQGVASVSVILAASGYPAMPPDPFNGAFQPVAGDVHAEFLLRLTQSLAAANLTLDQLTALLAAGGTGVTVPLS